VIFRHYSATQHSKGIPQIWPHTVLPQAFSKFLEFPHFIVLFCKYGTTNKKWSIYGFATGEYA
jgi:hypothetical protein